VHRHSADSLLRQSLLGAIGLGLLTFISLRLRLSLATASFIFLLFLASFSFVDDWRVAAALGVVASGVLGFFFASPIYSFWIDDPEDALSLLAFVAVLLIIAVLRDRRRRAVEALRQSESYLAEAQHVSHTGSFGWNPGTGAVYWSDETFRILACETTQHATLDVLLRRVHADDLARVRAVLERPMIQAECDISFRLELPGAFKHVRLVAKPASTHAGFIGALMDITELRRAEEGRRQVQADLARVNRVMLLGEITASIAHEVNQPIGATVTNANACARFLAAEPPNMEEARNALSRIVRDGRRAAEVVSRVRELMRNAPPQREPVELNQTILDVVGLIQGDLERHRIRLHAILAGGLPPVTGDRVQIQQVILNLLVNGIEAMHLTDDRSRDLSVHARQAVPDEVLVEVRDCGVGLQSAEADRLFDSFYTTKPQGMGMGLTISRSIIEAHGGRLWAAPNDPYGAIFSFTLPLEAQYTRV
jgi:C4-dicarboxylate-specific signal transduction histidine kinase